MQRLALLASPPPCVVGDYVAVGGDRGVLPEEERGPRLSVGGVPSPGRAVLGAVNRDRAMGGPSSSERPRWALRAVVDAAAPCGVGCLTI